MKNPQRNGSKACSQIDANDDDEEWTLVTYWKGGKRNPSKPVKTPKRSKMVRQSTNNLKPKVTKKKLPNPSTKARLGKNQESQ